jgi:hypothetical protein
MDDKFETKQTTLSIYREEYDEFSTEAALYGSLVTPHIQNGMRSLRFALFNPDAFSL